MATRCRLNSQQKKDICQFSAENPTMTQAELLSYFNGKWSTQIARSSMSSILKGKDKWLAVDERSSNQLTARSCAYKLLEDALYLWIVSNGPSCKGGDIGGDAIREMAL